jgi:hypothetical protein
MTRRSVEAFPSKFSIESLLPRLSVKKYLRPAAAPPSQFATTGSPPNALVNCPRELRL